MEMACYKVSFVRSLAIKYGHVLFFELYKFSEKFFVRETSVSETRKKKWYFDFIKNCLARAISIKVFYAITDIIIALIVSCLHKMTVLLFKS